MRRAHCHGSSLRSFGGDTHRMRDDAPYPNSGLWLRNQTDAELQRILDGSFPGSPAFEGADRELGRRRAERSERRQLFWIRLTLLTTLALGIAGIAVTLLKF